MTTHTVWRDCRRDQNRLNQPAAVNPNRPLTRTVSRILLAGDFRGPDFSKLPQFFPQRPTQIGHVLDPRYTAVVYPLQHLLRTELLFAQIQKVLFHLHPGQAHQVDFALLQQRWQKFEFDLTTVAYQGTHSPGQEYADIFGSKAADIEDSGNMSGMKNAAVDALIASMVGAKTKADFLPACRALERVVAHSHVLIPQWTAGTHRIAYSAKRLAKPKEMPPYAAGEAWAIDTWWAK